MRAAAAIAALGLFAASADAAGQGVPAASTAPRLRGFVDFGYVATDRDRPDGFFGGRVLGQLVHPLADRWTVFGELGARARPDRLDVSLERISVRFSPRDELQLDLGRFLTPIAYGNTEYPSGGWARTAVDRPGILDRESGLLPLYSVGVRAAGELRAPAADVGYAVVFANGRDGDPSRPGDAGDFDGRRAWTVAAYARPAARPALRLGGAVHLGRPSTEVGLEVDERILSAHIAWERETPELLAEYVRIRHDVPSQDETYVGRAVYAQAAYRLSDRFRALKPYLRIEQRNTADGDPLHMPSIPDHRAEVFGVRYDFAPTAAAKVEYRSERFGSAGDRVGSVHFQLGLALTAPERPALVAAAPAAGPDSADAREAPASEPPVAPAKSTVSAKSAPAPAPRVDPVAIVVHPGAPVEDLTLPELRRIFRGDQRHWGDAVAVVLLVRSPLPAERDIVLGRIYQMGEAEFRQLWLNKIFREAMVSGPKVVSDLETARRLVASLSGAITFLPASEVGPALRVVRIDGKLPGEPGYPLQ